MNSKSILNSIDSAAANLYVDLFGEHNGLSTFLFHGVSHNEKLTESIFPQEGLTISLFEKFIDSFLNLGYEFIGPADIIDGIIKHDVKYGMLTFDDGYFNNTWIQEVLHKYRTPAVFFVTTGLMMENEKIWSDVIHFERKKRNSPDDEIHKEIVSLNPVPVAKIKDYITKEFGSKALQPHGDEDRFLTPAELKEFALDPFVIIGNHTHSHEVLGNLTAEKTKAEIETSQSILTEIIGKAPDFISYPYGSHSRQVVDTAKEFGFKLGITTIQKKNSLPLGSKYNMELRRFNPIASNGKFKIDKLRSSFQLKTMLKEILQ